MKFQNEFKDSPLRAQGLYILGSCWLNLTKIEEALAVFKEILKLNPQDISLLQKVEYEIADCFYKLGQVDEALSRFKMIRARYPDSKLTAEVMWWLGQYYLEHEDLNLARRYFNSLVQDFSGSSLIADAYYALGLISQQENNFEEAVKNFNLAFKFGNAGLGNQALIALGDLNLEKENFQEALDTYQELLKNNPQLSKVLLGRIADTYYKLQDYKKAKSFYLQSLEVVDSKELANMRFKFAEVLEANSELNAAAKEYLEVAKLSRGDLKLLLRALLRAAKLYEDQDKYLEAAKIYAQVVDKGTEEGRFAKERLEWIMANVYKK